MTLNESSLALQIQEGHATDPTIATLLVQQFAPGVQRLTLSLLNGHPDAPASARSITQQTFVHALNDPESFMGKEDIRAWLYAQAMNLLKTVKPPIRKPQYLPVLLRYGHHLPLIEIAHLLRTSEAKIHKQLTEVRQRLIHRVDGSANLQVTEWASQRVTESASQQESDSTSQRVSESLSQRSTDQPIHRSTNQPINHPPAPLPPSHFPRETQRLLDHILDPEAEANFREHLETCPDCHEHLLHFTQLETYLDTTLFYDTALPEEQVQDIVQAVLQYKHPTQKAWQMPPVLTRLPFREMGWVFSAAVVFLFLARWLNPYFSSPPPRRTPTPAPTATLPPAQALSTVFRQTNPSLISATSPGQHILWSLTNSRSGSQIPGTPIAFSRHSYASFGQENQVIFWNLETFSQLPLEGHTAPVTALAFFPQEIMLATGDESGNILLWDLVDQRIRFRLEGQPGAIHQLAVSQDGRYLAVALDVGVWIWEIKTHTVQLIQKYRWEGIRLATFSPDGQYLAASDRENTIIVWSFPAGKFLLRYETLENSEPDQLTQLVYAPNSNTLATGSLDGHVEVVTLTPNKDSLQGARLFVLPHPGPVSDVQWAPDGNTLAVVSDNGATGDQDSSGRAIYLWDSKTGTLATAPLTARVAGDISQIKFSPVDGSISATNLMGDWLQWTSDDVSHLVAAVPDPKLFTRTASNLLEGPLPADTLPLQFTDVPSTTLSFIPFTLSPLLQTFSNRYTLTGGQHSVEDGVIALNYHISSGETLILTQRALTDGGIPDVGRTIGASAVVQPVQIHGTVGEYVAGSWTLTYPDNPDGTDENALYRWQPTGEARLRWIQAGLLMEIRVPQFQFQHGNLTMGELVILAENLVAQTETPILYTYTIEDGDTCVGIAQRYGVTPNRIAEVNGMENCDLIVAGQPLLVPLPTARTTVAEADLNCDGKLERVRAIPDPLLGDLSANFGVVVEAIPAGGDQYWPIWQETIADVTAVFFGLPQIYEGSTCESFLGISIFAGEGQHSGLDLYRWDGTALQMVLDANGFAKEFTPPGTTPFQITTQSLVRDVAAGGCTRTTTTYEWDGTAFAPIDEIREEGVECLEG